MADIVKKDAKKFLGDVPKEYVFRCHDGRIMKNMKDLQSSLKIMSEETFKFHSNATKNDFATWVKDIIKDDKLATDLAKSVGRTQTLKTVAARIESLSSK